jgi:foldase protein PrsA
MIVSRLTAVFMIAGILLVSACSKPAATVNGKKISKETLEMHLKERVEEHKRQNITIDSKKLRESVIQELVSERIALDEAAARGITASDADVNREIDAIKQRFGEETFQKSLKEKGMTVDSFRQRIKEKIVLVRFIDTFAENDITEKEIADYYKSSPKPFIKPARVNMKIVEFQSEDAAIATAEDLKKTKTDFDQYADKLSKENRANVTDYGWVSPEFFSPTMAGAIKSLKDGQHGGPYKGQKGFFLVRVKERQPESISSYDEVKDMIRNQLLQQKRTEAYMKWLGQKRSASKIDINLS